MAWRIVLMKKTGTGPRYLPWIIRLFRLLPHNDEARITGKQLLRSGTSVTANFRASCRALSTKEYFDKICTVVEECDETIFWLELLNGSNILNSDILKSLLKEPEKLIAIFATTKKNIKLQSPTHKFTNLPTH